MGNWTSLNIRVNHDGRRGTPVGVARRVSGRRSLASKIPIGIVAPLLALLVLAGPTLRLTSQSAMAHPAISPQILICGGSGNREWIVQDCNFRAAGIATWEEEIIDGLLQAHELPASDRHLILDWERDSVRAALFSRLVEAATEDPAQRSTTEQQIINMFATRIQANRIAAAQFSVNEYNRWHANQCGYVAPPGFNYQIDLAVCNNPLGGLFDTPTPPTLQEFLNYGAAHVYADFQSDAALRNSAAQMARIYGLLGGLAAVGVAAGIGAAIGASLTVSSAIAVAIHPFLAAAVAGVNTAAATTAVAGASAAFTTVGSFVGLAVMVVLAIVIGVIQGISVFTEAAIPGQLNDNLATAQTTPDLRQVVSTAAGKGEVMAVLLETTMPDFASVSSVPAQQASDPQFELTNPDGTRTISQSFGYQCWNPVKCADALNHTARVAGGWFVDRNGTGAERLTLGIDYIDWQGKGWTAWRVGDTYLHTRTGDGSTPFLSDLIKFKAWDGANVKAELFTPLTFAVTSSSPQEGAPVTFTITGSHSEGDGLTYTWDFGDGTPEVEGSDASVSHTYVDDGRYTVEVVAEGELASEIPTIDVTVANVAPVLTYSGAPTTSPEGTTITVSGSASDPGTHDTVTLNWTVKKYDASDQLSVFATGSGETFSFTPSDGGSFGTFFLARIDGELLVFEFGNYIVTLTATDNDGGVSETGSVINVTNVAPTVAITNVPETSVGEGSRLELGANLTEPSGLDRTFMTYEWTVTKDGEPYPSVPPFVGNGRILTPDDDGEYAVTLKATDKDGGVGSTTTQITVDNVNPVVTIDEIRDAAGRIVDDGDNVLADLPINVDESYSDVGPLDSRTASRDWGDGTITALGTVVDATTGTHVYPQAGTYTLRVMVTDDDGGTSEATRQIVVVTPAGGVETAIDGLREATSMSATATGAIAAALNDLDGNNGGKATNGAIDKLLSGDLNAGLVQIGAALEDLRAAGVADPSLDLTSIQEQLVLTAKSVAVKAVADAKTAAEIDGTMTTSEQQQLNEANAALDSGNSQFEDDDYIRAVGTFRTALNIALDMLD